MIRRACRFVLTKGAIVGVAYGVVRVLRGPPAPAFDDDANRARQPWVPPGWSGDTSPAAPEPSREAAAEPEPEPEPESTTAPQTAATPEVTTNGESSEPSPVSESLPTRGAEPTWPPAPEPGPAEATPALDPTASLGTAGDGSSADGAATTAEPAEDAEDRPPRPARTRRTRPIRVRRQSKAPATEVSPWVAPTAGEAPASHPVKAKMRSRIYHLPGMLSYDRTVPDRCYVDAVAAEADGLRIAKR